MTTDIIIDFNEDKERALLYSKLRGLRGKYRVTVKKYRSKRTDRQNRYYHPVFCRGLAQALCDQGQFTTPQQAHEIIKYKFLSVTIEDEKTGEELTYTKSTTELDVAEFNEFLDHVAVWLHDLFGLILPEPDVFHT